MKKFLIIALIISALLIVPKKDAFANEQITYLSFNKLLAYPQIALDVKNKNAEDNDENHLTPDEFSKSLESLYNSNYVLVNISDELKDKNKKPLVLFFHNLNYTSSTKSNGFIDKLIIDKSGNIATYTSKRSINERIRTDNECIPLLEQFIITHPLFSQDGARATIVLNNDDGIFGYKTAKSNATSKYDIKNAITIANKLKKLGYKFACEDFEISQNLNELNFTSQLNTWNNHTSKICGETNIYIKNNEKIDDFKLNLLKNNGFSKIFDNNNTINVSGKTLRENLELHNILDCENIYNHEIRKKLYYTVIKKDNAKALS
ncbi:MAG: hypothetical protein IK070_02545 [Clostridia bacterium]|nr:hypothetical protein [Clostridia bacterium]